MKWSSLLFFQNENCFRVMSDLSIKIWKYVHQVLQFPVLQTDEQTNPDLFCDLVTWLFDLWHWQSIGFCTNPRNIYVSNLLKICQCVRQLCVIFHPDRQKNRQTKILAKMQILANNKQTNRDENMAFGVRKSCIQILDSNTRILIIFPFFHSRLILKRYRFGTPWQFYLFFFVLCPTPSLKSTRRSIHMFCR